MSFGVSQYLSKRTLPASSYLLRVREILKISLPITLQSAAGSLMGLTDLMMVNHLGTAAIAAIGIINRWHIVFILLLGSISTANAILTAQFFGARNYQSCKEVFFRSLVIGLLFSVIVTLLFYLFRIELITFSTSDPDAINQANLFLLYSLPIFTLTYIVILLESSIRSTGDSKTPFVFCILAIVINAALNYVFIYGKFGLPALGVCGAALATVTARIIHVLLFIAYIIIKKHWLWFETFTIGVISDWISYVKFIVPIALSISLWALGALVYTLCFSRISPDAAAIYSLAMSLDGLLFSLFYGLSAGSSILIGHELGAGRDGKKIASTSLSIGIVLSVLVCISLFLFKEPVAALLININSSAYSELTKLLTVMSLLFWIRALNVIIINGFLRSGGDNRYCFFTDITSAWLVGIPILLILQQMFDLPLYILFAGIFIEEFVKLILAIRRYLSGKWIHNLTSNFNS